MMKNKSLKDISWDVSEEEYRADSALSYSTLAKYERTGFNGIEHLFDKVESASLTLGSAVDSIITGGHKEFDSRFFVAEFPAISDNILSIVKLLFEKYKNECDSLYKIKDEDIIELTETNKYQLNWKPETRAKVIREKASEYYKLLFQAKDKTILDMETYQNVCNMVDKLKNSFATRYYFQEDNPIDGIERLYQLKFKATFNSIDYRIMADLLIIDHDEKWIMPVDLKTSSHAEWDFAKSFIDWSYMIQARLYWRVIKANLEKNEYFKDFELKDYKFIVVNKTTLTPLVWGYTDTKTKGTLYYGKKGQIECRDPFVIGEELYSYLKNESKVPNEILIDNTNDLKHQLDKL